MIPGQKIKVTLNLQAPYLKGEHTVIFKMVLHQKDGEREEEEPEPFKNVVLQMKLKVDQPSEDPQQGDKRSFISIVSSF